jgi:hypothetical protein
MSVRRKGAILILAASALAAITSFVFAQPAQPEPVLVLYSQWNLAYAKSACKSAEIWYKSVGQTAERLGCENFESCPKMLATAKACRARGAVAALRDFEQQLTGALAAEPGCRGIAVVRYSGPGDAAYEKLTQSRDPAGFWTLSVDFSPGAATQSWRLQQRAKSASGDDEPQTIVSEACALILGRGPKAN